MAWNQKRNFRNASGGRMEHYGEKKVCCEFAGLSTPVNTKFQVGDARNPLASVARITEHGKGQRRRTTTSSTRALRRRQ